MHRNLIGFLVVLAVAGSALGLTSSQDKKYTVKQVMQRTNGKDSPLLKKVLSGSASDEEKAKLVEYYESMPLNKPKRGDAAHFKKMGETMLVAAKAAQNGEPGWKEKLQKATNCKGCHDVHK